MEGHKKKGLNIIISGEVNSTNLGDRLIIKNAVSKIKTIMPLSEVEVIGVTPEKKGLVLNHIINIRWRGKKVIAAFLYYHKLKKKKNYDLIIFPGGELFLDYFIEFLECAVKFAEKYGLAVCFSSVGIGKLTSDDLDRLEKILLMPSVKYISLRDNYHILKRVANIRHTYDSILAYKDGKEKKGNYYGIGIINPQLIYKYCGIEEDDFENALVSLINENAEKKDVIVFTSGDSFDNKYLNHLCASRKLKNIKGFITPHNIEEWLRIYDSFSCVISFRMHSLIVAYTKDIPIYGIAWDEKVNHLFEIIGESEKVIGIEDFINGKELETKKYDYDIFLREKIDRNINCDFQEMIEMIKNGL